MSTNGLVNHMKDRYKVAHLIMSVGGWQLKPEVCILNGPETRETYRQVPTGRKSTLNATITTALTRAHHDFPLHPHHNGTTHFLRGTPPPHSQPPLVSHTDSQCATWVLEPTELAWEALMEEAWAKVKGHIWQGIRHLRGASRQSTTPEATPSLKPAN